MQPSFPRMLCTHSMYAYALTAEYFKTFTYCHGSPFALTRPFFPLTSCFVCVLAKLCPFLLFLVRRMLRMMWNANAAMCTECVCILTYEISASKILTPFPSLYDAPTVCRATVLLGPGRGATLSGSADHGYDGSEQPR